MGCLRRWRGSLGDEGRGVDGGGESELVDEAVDEVGEVGAGVVAGEDEVGGGADGGGCVAHGDAESGAGEHGDVVHVVADGDDLLGGDVPEIGQVEDGGPLGGVGAEDLAHGALVGGAALDERAEVRPQAIEEELLEEEHVGAVTDGEEVEVSGGVGVGHPAGNGEGVGLVSGDVFVEEVSGGGEGGDEEVGAIGSVVDHGDGGLAVVEEQLEDGAGERRWNLGFPEGAVSFGVFDEGAGVADEGGVEFEVEGDGESSAVSPTGAEDWGEPEPGGPPDGLDGPLGHFAGGVEQGAVDIEGQDAVVGHGWGVSLGLGRNRRMRHGVLETM